MWAHGGHGQGHAIARLVLFDVAIGHSVGMAVGEAEVQTCLGHAVEFVFRAFIAHPVAAMVAEPQFFGHGVPVKTHGVAHAGGDHFHARTIGVVTADLGVFSAGLADVARCAKRHVQLAVRTEAQVFPVVVLQRGQLERGGHVHRLCVGVGFDAVIAQHFVDAHDVQVALVHGDGGLVEFVHQHAAGALFAVVADFINTAQATGARVNLAALTTAHGAHARGAGGPDFDLEAWWQFELVQWNVCRRCGGQLARQRGQCGVGHFGGHALLPSRRWGGGGGCLGHGLSDAECQNGGADCNFLEHQKSS